MPGAEDDDKNAPKLDADGKPIIDPNAPAKDGKEGEVDPPADESSFKTIEEAQAEVKRLRKENANRRTQNRALDEQRKGAEEIMGKLKQALGIEDPQESPEVKAQQLQDRNAALQMELGITQLAVQNQIPHDQMEFFSFLFHKRASEMEEGEELDEEAMAELVSKAKSAGGTGGKKTSTSVPPGSPPPSGKAGDATLEEFIKMNPGEKGGLYNSNPTLYNRLFQEASQKRLL